MRRFLTTGARAEQSGWTLLQRQVASASAAVNFFPLQTAYEEFLFVFDSVVPQTDTANLGLQVGTGATPTYDTGNNYSYQGFVSSPAAGLAAATATAQSSILLIAGLGTGTGENAGGSVIVHNPISALYKTVDSSAFAYSNVPELALRHHVGLYLSTTAVTAVRFIMSSGNIDAGTFKMFGMKFAS